MGAALLLRREALEDVGLFDEDFFIYFEEVDLCLRLRRAGWEVRYFRQSPSFTTSRSSVWESRTGGSTNCGVAGIATGESTIPAQELASLPLRPARSI